MESNNFVVENLLKSLFHNQVEISPIEQKRIRQTLEKALTDGKYDIFDKLFFELYLTPEKTIDEIAEKLGIDLSEGAPMNSDSHLELLCTALSTGKKKSFESLAAQRVISEETYEAIAGKLK